MLLPFLQPVHGCKVWVPWIGPKVDRVAQKVDVEAADAFISGFQTQSRAAGCVSSAVSAVERGQSPAVRNSLATTGAIFMPWMSHTIINGDTLSLSRLNLSAACLTCELIMHFQQPEANLSHTMI